MRGATQIENLVKKLKITHKKYQNVCYERWHEHDLTVHGRSTSNGIRVCFEMFLKTLILERLLLGTDLQIKFHNLTILLKCEA